jgi:hypothetical protein
MSKPPLPVPPVPPAPPLLLPVAGLLSWLLPSGSVPAAHACTARPANKPQDAMPVVILNVSSIEPPKSAAPSEEAVTDHPPRNHDQISSKFFRDVHCARASGHDLAQMGIS